MRILLDQGLPRHAAQLLREGGTDAVHTGESGLACSSDREILDFARKHRRIVVTLDSDFHALMALSGAAEPSVVRIRVEGLKAPALVGLLNVVLDRCRNELDHGALVTVERHRIRIRCLPIGTRT